MYTVKNIVKHWWCSHPSYPCATVQPLPFLEWAITLCSYCKSTISLWLFHYNHHSEMKNIVSDIHIYAFDRCFYPMQHCIQGTHCFTHFLLSLGIMPMTLVLLQCHTLLFELQKGFIWTDTRRTFKTIRHNWQRFWLQGL